MALIHANEQDDAHALVNYCDIVKNKFLPGNKLKFIQIKTKSVEEARRRAAILALLSSSIMRGPSIFVKLFS